MPLSSSIAERLKHQHETIREIVAGCPDSELRERRITGKWSAFENIAHLAAYQPVFAGRLDRIAREPSPAFDRYVAENDPLFPEYLERPTASLLEQITADRIGICSVLLSADDAYLARIGTHPKFGRLTVSGWTEFFLLHEAHHLYTLFGLVTSPK